MTVVQGRASVILITYNGLNYTQQCLESVYAHTRYPDFEVVIVDNASQDGTPRYLEAFAQDHANATVILNEENEGFARGNNIGAAGATGEFIVFLNNDTVVTPGWLEGLVGHLQDPEIGMVGPVTNSSGNETRIEVPYEDLGDMSQFAAEYTAARRGEVHDIQALPFLCVALRRGVFEEVGPLDERFGLGMFEDDDYAMRVRAHGYRVVYAEDVFVHHWGGGSFKEMAPYRYWKLFRENRRKYEEKWGEKWRPHLHRDELLADQVIQFAEWGYTLQWELLHRDRHIQRLETEIHELREKVYALTQHLEEIEASRAWKLVRRYRQLRQFLAGERTPPGEAAGGDRSEEPEGWAEQATALTGAPDPDVTRKNQVAILVSQFFDFEGRQIFLGGAERYLVELAGLIRQLGYQPVVYQSAQGDWSREFDGFPVIGLDTRGDPHTLNLLFHERVPPDTPSIYLAFYLAAPRCNPRSIGVSHGVFWDKHARFLGEDRQVLAEILTPIDNLAAMVSVDTNTINWVRSTQSSLAEKIVYIPNFVNPKQFHPVSGRRDDGLTVLYPRRLYPPRGFWMVWELVPEFLGAYDNLDFLFVGQADAQEKAAVKELVKRYPERVSWRSLSLESMHRAYQEADVTLIPTLHSEGTSLSCLEAMASGNAVIATNVGGLPDLVISGYNGLLIEPKVPALRTALRALLDDQDLRETLSNRAVDVASSFSIDNWREKWTELLSGILKHNTP